MSAEVLSITMEDAASEGDVSISRRIVTSFVYPPIPVRSFDWSAIREGYEPGDPIGVGATELGAIQSLLGQEEDAQ
jgi:hypothetical protein